MTAKRQAPKSFWTGGAYDRMGHETPIEFPGFSALRAAFPIHRIIMRRRHARITHAMLAPAGGAPMPAVLAEEIVNTLRDGGAVAIFAASHADMTAGLAAIRAASALTEFCGAKSGDRK